MKKVTWPLKFKISALLVALTLITLGLFSFLAIKVFREDKTSFIFDSSLQSAKSVSRSLKQEFQSYIESTQLLSQSVDLNSQALSPAGDFLFAQKSNWMHYEIFSLEGLAETRISKSKFDLKPQIALLKQNIQKRAQEKFFFEVIDPRLNLVAVVFQAERTEAQPKLWTISIFRSAELQSIAQSIGANVTWVIQPASSMLIGQMDDRYLELKTRVMSFIAAESTPESTQFFKFKEESYLASFTKVGIGDLSVAVSVPESVAFAALKKFIIQALVFAGMLISLVLLAGWLLSSKLTSSLTELSRATSLIARGDFETKLKVKSADEVGVLSEGFNLMTAEIKRLLSETVEKARMEAELKTAQTVQNTLFPASEASWDGMKIHGYYSSASECGGDWWYYHQNEDRIFVWIGDATGHGAPAALITSAARAAVSLVEWQKDITPGQALRLLNRAIYSTSRGGMMMTFFAGCFDLKTNTFSYANASHNPPFLIRSARSHALSKQDFEPLIESNNPRLGQSLDHFFEEASVQLASGDHLVLYTDGVTELKDPEDKDFGERRFIKTIVKAFAESQDLSQTLKITLEGTEEHRQNRALTDDVTLVLCEFSGRVAAVKAA
jgi:phosphoserine phosphatase RsbU/P